jgi:LacI family gluconate utilization system Gnt-I transcriptional repressor
MRELLKVTPRCDAVFCCNDDLAYGAIYECQAQGLRVPGDLAIVGFNDLEQSASLYPSVTSVATPRYQVGYESAQMLLAAVRKQNIAQPHLDLGFKLVVRDSG